MASELPGALDPECVRFDPLPATCAGVLPSETLDRLTRLAARSLRAPVAVVALRVGAEQLAVATAIGVPQGRVRTVPLTGVPLASLVARPQGRGEGRPIAVPAQPLAGALGVQSCLAAPLLHRDTLMGVVAVGDPEPRAWTEAEAEILGDLAALAAQTLEPSAEPVDSAACSPCGSRVGPAAGAPPGKGADAEAEAALRRLRHEAAILGAIPDAVVVTDLGGAVTYWNRGAARLFGWSEAEMLGAPLTVPLPGALQARRGSGEPASPAGVTAPGEYQGTRKDGSHFPAQLTTGAVRDGHGHLVGQTMLIRDLSPEKRREARLRRAERVAAVGTLLSGLAHELNNPLTSIKSFAQLLLLDERPAEDRDGLEVIRHEADRAAKLVADLRALGWQAQEETEPDVRRVLEVNELVQRVLQGCRAEVQAHGVILEAEPSDERLWVHGDRVALEEAVRQLVLHARGAGAAGGARRRVLVRTRPSRKGVVVSVTGATSGGGGDPPERIFDPFQAAGEGSQDLALAWSGARLVAERHGGEIRTEGAPGGGATVLMELPCVRHDTTTAWGAASSAPLRILLVEQAAPARESLARFLVRRGHQVDAVAYARQAVQRLDEGAQYQMIVSDLSRRGTGRCELLDRLLTDGVGAQRLVFLVDEEARADAERVAAPSGAPVVVKPFAFAEVAELIERRVLLG